MSMGSFRFFAVCVAVLSAFAPTVRVYGAQYVVLKGSFNYGYAQEVLRLVNEERKSRGRSALVMTKALTDAAMKRAAETEVVCDATHRRPNGEECLTAVPWEGSFGENIAWGYGSPKEVVDGWMESPGHKAAILSANFTSIGIGCFLEDDSAFIRWTQDFSGGKGKSDKRTGCRKVKVKVSLVRGKDSIVTFRDDPDSPVDSYTVKFAANGGNLPKGKKMSSQTFKYGKAAKLRKNVFTRKGYVFAGWARSKVDAKKGIVAYANAQKVKNLTAKGGTVKLYAVWAKPKYKVKFYANGGKGKMKVQTFKYGKAKKLSANKFKAPEGKEFAGWAKSQADATKGKVAYKNKKAVKNLVSTGKTVTLYAVWEEK